LNGKFYDLKHNKSLVGFFEDFEQVLLSKRIPMLYIHTNFTIDTTAFDQHFKQYESLEKGLTCLSPIKDFLNWQNAKTIFDFIKNLETNGITMEFTGHNIELLNNTFEIREYSEKEIKSYIQTLKN